MSLLHFTTLHTFIQYWMLLVSVFFFHFSTAQTHWSGSSSNEWVALRKAYNPELLELSPHWKLKSQDIFFLCDTNIFILYLVSFSIVITHIWSFPKSVLHVQCFVNFHIISPYTAYLCIITYILYIHTIEIPTYIHLYINTYIWIPICLHKYLYRNTCICHYINTSMVYMYTPVHVSVLSYFLQFFRFQFYSWSFENLYQLSYVWTKHIFKPYTRKNV